MCINIKIDNHAMFNYENLTLKSLLSDIPRLLNENFDKLNAVIKRFYNSNSEALVCNTFDVEGQIEADTIKTNSLIVKTKDEQIIFSNLLSRIKYLENELLDEQQNEGGSDKPDTPDIPIIPPGPDNPTPDEPIEYIYDNCVSISDYMTQLENVYDIINVYREEEQLEDSTNVLLARYIRSLHYNDVYWNTLYGTSSLDLADIVNDAYPTFKDIDYVYVLPDTYIDIVHFWAALEALMSPTNKDLGGWAGDVVDLATYIPIDNPTVEFPGKGFEHEDIVSDFDAIAVYYYMTSNNINSVVTAFEYVYNNYVNNIITFEEANKYRISKFVEYKGSSDIKSLYNNSDSIIALSVLAVQRNVSNDTLEKAINALQEYVYNVLDVTFKYEDSNSLILSSFNPFNNEERNSFNDYTIIPFAAYSMGVYDNNNEKIGSIDVSAIKPEYGTRKYRVGLMSDIHYNDFTTDSSVGTISYDGSEYDADLRNALEFYENHEDISFICAAGDITSNNIINALNFKKALDTYSPTTTFYTCYGNHDFASVEDGIDDNEIGYDINNKSAEQVWAELMIPSQPYTIHYQDPTTWLGRSSYYFEVPIAGTQKSDIYIFLSVNYDNGNNSTATTQLTASSPNIQGLIDYVGYMPSGYNLQFYDNSTLLWLKHTLEQYPNKRVFIFTHLFFVHKAGSNNGDNDFYHYGGLGDRWRMTNDSAYCLCGIQFEFLNKLNNEYTNTIWFTGHSHYKFNWQTKDKNININDNEYSIYRPDDNDFVYGMHYLRKDDTPISKSGFNVHIPSTSRPLQISNNYSPALGDSEGAVMDVYENYVDIRGIVFKETDNGYINKYYPCSQYRINIAAS